MMHVTQVALINQTATDQGRTFNSLLLQAPYQYPTLPSFASVFGFDVNDWALTMTLFTAVCQLILG